MLEHMLKHSYIKSSENNPYFIPEHTLSKLKRSFRNIKNQKDSIAIIKALSDPTKLSVFLLLTEVEELPVTVLSEILDLSQSTVSHALADLKKLGIADCRSCGQSRCYFLKDPEKDRNSIIQLFTHVFI